MNFRDQPTPWTPERDAKLAEMRAAGYTSRQIAEEIGDGITRNAVIGRANRLGLGVPTKASVTRKANRVVDAVTAPKARPRYLPLEKLKITSCRWPIGKQHPYSFCGHRAVAGRSYCQAHYEASVMKVAAPSTFRRGHDIRNIENRAGQRRRAAV